MARGCLPAQLRPAPLLWAVVPPSFQPWGALGPCQNTLHELFLLKLSNLWFCYPSQQKASPNSLNEASGAFSYEAAETEPLCCVSPRTVAGAL